MVPSEKKCPFCTPPADQIVLEGAQARVLWDTHPVSPGHVLIVPRRHVGSLFESTHAERQEMLRLTDEAHRILVEKHAPDGFNLGINEACGEAVGTAPPQHMIPRYRGDVLTARRRAVDPRESRAVLNKP